MKKISLLVMVLLAGCASDGSLTPQGRTVVSVLCAVDEGAPAAIGAGAAIATLVEPEVAPGAVIATRVDALAHPQVQAACANALAGSKPVDATVTVVAPK